MGQFGKLGLKIEHGTVESEYLSYLDSSLADVVIHSYPMGRRVPSGSHAAGVSSIRFQVGI